MKTRHVLKKLAAAICLMGVGAALNSVLGGNTSPVPKIVHGKPSDFKWVPLPEFGGSEAIIYRSPDGKRVAAGFKESGKSTFTYPFDEFLVVTSGAAKFMVRGGETYNVSKGDVAYIQEGTTVDFEMTPDFSDLTCLMGNHPVKWR